MKKALGVLKSIAGNDQVKEAIVETGLQCCSVHCI